MLKGVMKMLIAISSGAAVLACQGCVSVGAPQQVKSLAGPAYNVPVHASNGIKVAVPDALGVGTLAPVAPSVPDMTVAQQVPAGPSAAYGPRPEGQPIDPSFGIDFSSEPMTAFDSLTSANWSSSEAVQTYTAERDATRLVLPSVIEKDFSAEFAFAAPSEQTGLGFDVGLAPRVAYREEGEFLSRKVGGEVRIGQNFDKRGSASVDAGSWYIFAGADGEALVWDAARTGLAPSLDGMSLQDQVTVGDMQAGISLQRGGGQLSFSYIRREVEYRDRNGGMSEDEDFAGLSFTLRR